MVAGATGIDLFLMVVAADDGVMPQTREHATVLRALGVGTGVVAVTKADLADPARAAGEAAELLPGAEVVAVSAREGTGLDALGAALDRAAASVASRAGAGGAPRLHVDRAFTIRGAGTVVTGTLWSGTFARGDAVEILPAGRRARIRSVEIHDAPVERAEAGQRVALNLAGTAVGEVERGDVVVGAAAAEAGGLAAAGAAPRATYRIDAALEWASDAARPPGGARVAVHHGTRESAARLAELGGRYFQLRLEQPLVPAAGDRAGHPLAGAARHARRRRGAGPRSAPPRARPRPARPPRQAGARRARAAARAGAAGSARPSRSRSRRPRSPSRRSCARPAPSRRSTRTSTRAKRSPRCATPAASCASARPCTSTRSRWRPCATASSPCSRPRGS